jgi:two-component system chemotaxis response regulator CheY
MAKILAVDDEPSLLALMKDLLTLSGHNVHTADSAVDCLAKLRVGGFELLILDVNMPPLNGLEVLRMIRRDPALKTLPVLMCTARDMTDDLDQAFEAGANGYIVKPFTAAALNASVTKSLAAASKR